MDDFFIFNAGFIQLKKNTKTGFTGRFITSSIIFNLLQLIY
jgi:hypothetical protein